MDKNKVMTGLRVKTIELGSASGWHVMRQYLINRQPGIIGTVKSCLYGHNGSVWFIEPDNGQISVYSIDEFEPV